MYNRWSPHGTTLFFYFFLQMVILNSYRFSPKQIKELPLPWSSCYIGNMQKAVLLQFDLSIDKGIWWQDEGETPNIGQDGGRALETHREVHTGWEFGKDTLVKETRTFLQGKAAQISFLSHTCFLCIWTIILFFSTII